MAVVDLDEVARRSGRDLQLNRAVRERKDSLNRQLKEYHTSLRDQYGSKQREFGDRTTQQTEQQLKTIEDQFNLRLNQAQREASQDLSRHRLRLIQQFREEVIPVAREIAAARGLSIVIPKNETLFLTYDPGIDITDEVASRMIAGQGAPPPDPSAGSAGPAANPSQRTHYTAGRGARGTPR